MAEAAGWVGQLINRCVRTEVEPVLAPSAGPVNGVLRGLSTTVPRTVGPAGTRGRYRLDGRGDGRPPRVPDPTRDRGSVSLATELSGIISQIK